ncbi:33610_t:CDS:2, partial [Gigaspora margarita]
VDLNYNKPTKGQNIEFFSSAGNSQDSNTSNNEYVISDLSNTTNINPNKYVESNDLFSGIPKDPEDIYQEFPSEEYSNYNNYPLPIISQTGRAFIENLNLPSFGWRKEVIYKYEGLEYVFEFRTKNVEQNISIGAYVIPIILYSDATLCDYLEKTSKHLVFITLENIPLTCYGYIPSFEYSSMSQKQTFQFQLAIYELFHYTFAAMLQPLRSLSNTGIHLYVN